MASSVLNFKVVQECCTSRVCTKTDDALFGEKRKSCKIVWNNKQCIQLSHLNYTKNEMKKT